MTLGARIEERRRQVGLSQAELARRVGVSQSTMNSLINGSSRTSRSLLKIARELETTAAYLTGEADDPEGDSPLEPPLTYEARDLLASFDRLNSAERAAVLQIAKLMAGRVSSASTVHSPHDGYNSKGEQ